MILYQLTAGLSLMGHFFILCAIEGGGIKLLTAIILIVPMEMLLIWSFNRAGFIDAEAVNHDMNAIKKTIKETIKKALSTLTR